MKHLILLCGLVVSGCIAPAVGRADAALEARLDQLEKVVDRRLTDGIEKAEQKADLLVTKAEAKAERLVASSLDRLDETVLRTIRDVGTSADARIEKVGAAADERIRLLSSELQAGLKIVGQQREDFQRWAAEQRLQTVADLDRQRQETLADIDRQRRDTLADLDRQRKETLDAINAQREAMQAWGTATVETSVPKAAAAVTEDLAKKSGLKKDPETGEYSLWYTIALALGGTGAGGGLLSIFKTFERKRKGVKMYTPEEVKGIVEEALEQHARDEKVVAILAARSAPAVQGAGPKPSA